MKFRPEHFDFYNDEGKVPSPRMCADIANEVLKEWFGGNEFEFEVIQELYNLLAKHDVPFSEFMATPSVAFENVSPIVFINEVASNNRYDYKGAWFAVLGKAKRIYE